MDAIVLCEPEQVAAALEHPSFAPPRVDGPSATLGLRAAMARFSHADEHGARRAEVAAAIAHLDTGEAARIASARAAALLGAPRTDVLASIACRVPTETLASLLGLHDGIDEVVRDVEAIVRVIGRGEPATPDADAATDRLRLRFGGHALGWVPVASILYQGFDATMWLIAVRLHARATGRPDVAPVPRTRRVALRDSIMAGVAVRLGTEVVLEIGTAGLPYGAGPHRCPGTQLAEQIATGVVDAIIAGGYLVDLAAVVTDDDGRPTQLPIERS